MQELHVTGTNSLQWSFFLSSCNAPYLIILVWLMPDDFTHQGESAGA
jgi:hypothetical protein